MPPRTLLPESIRFPLEELKAAAVAAGGATDHADYLQEATEQLSRLVGSERCSLLVLRDGCLYHGGAVGLPSTYTTAIDGIEIGLDVGTCGSAAASGQPVVTADIRVDPKWEPFRELADRAGLRACWSVPLQLRGGEILGTFATYSEQPGAPDEDRVELARTHASLVALGLDRLRREERLSESYEAVVVALSSVLDVRDEYTGSHSAETAALAVEAGTVLGLTPSELHELERVAVLHDIGKLGVPTEILRAPRPLTDDERAVVERHPLIGEEILRGVPYLGDVARAVRHEHERWDGGGYPDGLAAEEIPLASRIVFVCDAWHAMTSDRPYRCALGRDLAVAELRDGAGSQFDPRVVRAVIELLSDREHEPPEPGDALGHSGAHGARDAEEEARTVVLRSVTEALGADDLFVFRRLSPGRFSHFGGVGRGESWAGNIELDSESEGLFLAALAAGVATCVSSEAPQRVVGPYYARSAMIVPCRSDVVVVFGSATDALVGACSGDATVLAERTAAVVDDVAPAKRLADELEVLEAVRSITTLGAASLEEALALIANAAAGALSCEFGAVVTFGEGAEPRLGFADRGFSPAEPGALADLLVPFMTSAVELPLLVQDVRASADLPAGFAERGATSIHALPIGTPSVAVLLLVHADAVPRGFTLLCRRVARAVAEASEIVIRRTLAQEELAEENARLSHRVRTDALTGVASREAWDEALRREELHRGRSGATTAIAVFDVDGLKEANDRHGHAAGDELLKVCAASLAGAARATDLVARIGGDEFAALLRYTDEEGAAVWCEQVTSSLRGRRSSTLGVSMAAGYGAAPPAATLAGAFVEADRRMYGAKSRAR